MKTITAVALLGMILILASCGANSHAAGNINGTWSATLSNSQPTLANVFLFTTNLTVNTDGTLGTSNFNITLNNTPCTFPATTESGSFTITGNFSGQVSGTFQYVIASTGEVVNTLTLNGMVKNGQITGTWSVTGATTNCTGTGTFTMNPMGPGMQ